MYPHKYLLIKGRKVAVLQWRNLHYQNAVRRAKHHSRVSCMKTVQPQSPCEKTSNTMEGCHLESGHWLVNVSRPWVTKTENFHRLKEPKEIWWLNALWDPDEILDQKKNNIMGKKTRFNKDLKVISEYFYENVSFPVSIILLDVTVRRTCVKSKGILYYYVQYKIFLV